MLRFFEINKDQMETPAVDVDFQDVVVGGHGIFGGTFIKAMGSMDGETFIQLDVITNGKIYRAAFSTDHIGSVILQKVKYIKLVGENDDKTFLDITNLKVFIKVFEVE